MPLHEKLSQKLSDLWEWVILYSIIVLLKLLVVIGYVACAAFAWVCVCVCCNVQ